MSTNSRGGGEHLPGGRAGEKPGAVVARAQRDEPASQAHHRVSLQVYPLLLLGEHPDSGYDQQGPKDVHDPVEAVEQERAQADHDEPHHDCAQDPPLEDLGLGIGSHTEVGEDQQEDEQVVNAEGELDEIAGVVLQRRLGALPPQNEQAEQKRQRHHPTAPPERLLQGEDVTAAVEHTQVEDQEAHDQGGEAQPDGGRVAPHSATDGHGLEPCNPLRRRWVGTEELGDDASLGGQRVDLGQRRHGRRHVHGYPVGQRIEPNESVG